MKRYRPLDPGSQALLRGLTARRMSRRDMLKLTGAGLGGTFLAACGVQGTQTRTPTPPGTGSASPGGTPTATPSPLPPKTGTVDVANWPLYIDLEDGESATLDNFAKTTGIKINYREVINDNDEFFGTDLQQQLSAGQRADWDVVVLTDWMIAKVIELGFLEPLRQEALPNAVANLDPKFRDPWYDPGNAYSYPYAAGITGIGYNIELTGRPITSLNDLFDPAFQGKVGMFSEMRDTLNFALLLQGLDPTTASLDQVEQAVGKLQQQRDAGLVRGYYGNDYTDQLAGGNLALTMAWSGDVNFLATEDPNLRFVVPEEGGNRWVDNMAIPVGAEHLTDAHEWINFVYDVEVATGITEWVWYESPVSGVRDQIRADAAEDESLLAVSESVLVWPDVAILSKLYPYKRLSLDEEEAWHEMFDPLLQG